MANRTEKMLRGAFPANFPRLDWDAVVCCQDCHTMRDAAQIKKSIVYSNDTYGFICEECFNGK